MKFKPHMSPSYRSPLMKAIRREPNYRVPVWLMRQAGRYMAEYRAVREKVSFLELCQRPRLAAEVMQTAVEKLNVDAAIIFSDLLLILQPLGFELEYTEEGPVIHNPIRTPDDLERMTGPLDLDRIAYVFETVAETRYLIDRSKPVIGFAGAPFTLAGYLIEGGTSRDFRRTKAFMRSYPAVWRELLAKLGRAVSRYLRAQLEAGAQVVQIFDSWVGCLSPNDYQRFVFTPTKRLVESIAKVAPAIYFGAGNPALVDTFPALGCQVIGIDWRQEIGETWQRLGYNCAIQGNLDPSVLMTNEQIIRREVSRILDAVGHIPGFIFNLGHGIPKEAPVENVRLLVDLVHEYRPDRQCPTSP